MQRPARPRDSAAAPPPPPPPIPWPSKWCIVHPRLWHWLYLTQLTHCRQHHKSQSTTDDTLHTVCRPPTTAATPTTMQDAKYRSLLRDVLLQATTAHTPYTLAPMDDVAKEAADAASHRAFNLEHLVPQAVWAVPHAAANADVHNVRMVRSLANLFRATVSFGEGPDDRPLRAADSNFLMWRRAAFLSPTSRVQLPRKKWPQQSVRRAKVWPPREIVDVAGREAESVRAVLLPKRAHHGAATELPPWDTARSVWQPPFASRGPIARAVLHVMVLYAGRWEAHEARLRTFLRFVPLWLLWDAEGEVEQGEWDMALTLADATGYVNPFVVWRVATQVDLPAFRTAPLTLSEVLLGRAPRRRRRGQAPPPLPQDLLLHFAPMLRAPRAALWRHLKDHVHVAATTPPPPSPPSPPAVDTEAHDDDDDDYDDDDDEGRVTASPSSAASDDIDVGGDDEGRVTAPPSSAASDTGTETGMPALAHSAAKLAALHADAVAPSASPDAAAAAAPDDAPFSMPPLHALLLPVVPSVPDDVGTGGGCVLL